MKFRSLKSEVTSLPPSGYFHDLGWPLAWMIIIGFLQVLRSCLCDLHMRQPRTGTGQLSPEGSAPGWCGRPQLPPLCSGAHCPLCRDFLRSVLWSEALPLTPSSLSAFTILICRLSLPSPAPSPWNLQEHFLPINGLHI